MKHTKVSPISHESIASAIALKMKTIVSQIIYHLIHMYHRLTL